MKTSSTLIRGQQDLGALVASVVEMMDREVGRIARAQAVVGLVRFGVGIDHVGLDVMGEAGEWERIAATPGTIATDPARLELRVGTRKIGRLEIDGSNARRGQRAMLHGVLPLLARAVAPASFAPFIPKPIGLPPMALEQAVAFWGLTRREAEVLALIATGMTNKVIAEKLGCTEGTLEHHVRAVLRKAGCAARGELIAVAWSRLGR